MGPHREAILHEDSLVHGWRVAQLKRPGIPGLLAQAEADKVDWHQIARLVQRWLFNAARATYSPLTLGIHRVSTAVHLAVATDAPVWVDCPVRAATPPRPAAPRRRAAADLLIPDTRRA
jgi:hypothetical protein